MSGMFEIKSVMNWLYANGDDALKAMMERCEFSSPSGRKRIWRYMAARAFGTTMEDVTKEQRKKVEDQMIHAYLIDVVRTMGAGNFLFVYLNPAKGDEASGD